MSGQVQPQVLVTPTGPDPKVPDVDLVYKPANGKWKLKNPGQQEVYKSPGSEFVIAGPLDGSQPFRVWFDPSGLLIHESNDHGQIVIEIPESIPHTADADLVANDYTAYKYTIEIAGQIIDPKIIIDPPTP